MNGRPAPFGVTRDPAAKDRPAALPGGMTETGVIIAPAHAPRQVEIANAVFTPGPAQIEYARRVIAAWEDARASERGVFTLDGKMIDAPLVAVQRRVLERARRAGALPDTSEA